MDLSSATHLVTAALLLIGGVTAFSACGGRSDLDSGRTESNEPVTPLDPPGLPDLPLSYACRRAAATRPMLAAAIDGELKFVYPDRTTRLVYNFGVPDDHRVTSVIVKSFVDRVAAQVLSVEKGMGKRPAIIQLAHLSLDGSVLFEATVPYDYQNSGNDFSIHGRGDLIIHTAQLASDGRMFVVDRNELRDPAFVRWAGRGAPNAAGRAMVLDTDASSTAARHFLDLRTGASAESTYISDPFPSVASSIATIDSPEGAAMLYLRRNPSRVVLETASGIREAPIAIDIPDDQGHLAVSYQHGGQWVGFRDGGVSSEGDVVHLVHGRTLESRSVPIDWPVQVSPHFGGRPAIDENGAMIWALDSAGDTKQLWRTTDGANWDLLADAFPPNTVVGEVAVAGSTVQVARRLFAAGDLAGYPLDHGPVQPSIHVLSADGKCHAYYRGADLRVVEVDSYADTAIDGATRELSATVTWIPIAASQNEPQ